MEHRVIPVHVRTQADRSLAERGQYLVQMTPIGEEDLCDLCDLCELCDLCDLCSHVICPDVCPR